MAKLMPKRRIQKELGGAFPERIARADVASLHDGDDKTETEGQRHEEPVVGGRHSKLRTRPIDSG